MAQYRSYVCGNPTGDPTYSDEKKKNGETTHFFTDDSTRTFALQRDGKEIRFFTEGRNETLNMASEGGPYAGSNALGGSGIIYGGAELYWHVFGKQLLNR